jgi:ligand-binding sensor protein
MTKQATATYEDVGQAVTKLGDFFRFCNEKRRHHTVVYRRPAEVY